MGSSFTRPAISASVLFFGAFLGFFEASIAAELAGYLGHALSHGQPGAVSVVALATDTTSEPELLYDGIPLGLFLKDDGAGPDFAAGDNVYSLDVIFQELPQGSFLLELATTDARGLGHQWPYLTVLESAWPTATPSPTATPTPDPTSTPAASPTPVPTLSTCNPLSVDQCILPYPSSHYLVADASMATGYRIDIPQAAMPRQNDPSRINLFDGWGYQVPIMAEFPGKIDTSSFPAFEDVNASLSAGSPFLVFNIDPSSLEYGKQIPVRVEVRETGSHTAINLLAATALDSTTRYGVGLRNLRAPDGSRVATSFAFEQLRDGQAAGTSVGHLASEYEELFLFFETQGTPRSALDLAWEFRTASAQSLTGPLAHMVDEALGSFDPATAQWSVVWEDTSRGRLYTCFCSGPNFIGPDKRLSLGPDTLPRQLNNQLFRFFIYVPDSALNASDRPVPSVLYGHGMGNTGEQVRNSYLEYHGSVGIAPDWTGLLAADYLDMANAVLNGPVTQIPTISDRLMQAVVNATILSKQVPQIASRLESEFGSPVIDASKHFYFGESLGGVMGSTVMAVHDEMEAGALVVPGGSITQIIQKSEFFQDELIGNITFQDILNAIYPDAIEQQLFFNLMQSAIESIDPISFAPHWSHQPLGSRQPRHILMQEGIGDPVVPNFCTEILLSSSRLPLLAPFVEPIVGVPTFAAPTNGALFGGCYQFASGGHGAGKHPEAMNQQRTFLRSFYDPAFAPYGNIPVATVP